MSEELRSSPSASLNQQVSAQTSPEIALAGEENELKGDGSIEPKLSSVIKSLELVLADQEKESAQDDLILTTLENLIEAHGKLGNYAQQDKLLDRMLSILKGADLPDIEEIVATLKRKSEVNGKLKNHGIQLRILKEALEIQQENLLGNDPEIAITYAEMAIVYRLVEQVEQAQQYEQNFHAIAALHLDDPSIQQYLKELPFEKALSESKEKEEKEETVSTSVHPSSATSPPSWWERAHKMVEATLKLFDVINPYFDFLGVKKPDKYIENILREFAKNGELNEDIVTVLDEITEEKFSKSIAELKAVESSQDLALEVAEYLMDFSIEELREKLAQHKLNEASAPPKRTGKQAIAFPRGVVIKPRRLDFDRELISKSAKEMLSSFVEEQKDFLTNPSNTKDIFIEVLHGWIKLLEKQLKRSDYEQVIKTLADLSQAYGEIGKQAEEQTCLNLAMIILDEAFAHDPIKYKSLHLILTRTVQQSIIGLNQALREGRKRNNSLTQPSAARREPPSLAGLSARFGALSPRGRRNSTEAGIDQAVSDLLDEISKQCRGENERYYTDAAMTTLTFLAFTDGSTSLNESLKGANTPEFLVAAILKQVNENPILNQLKSHPQIASDFINSLLDVAQSPEEEGAISLFH